MPRAWPLVWVVAATGVVGCHLAGGLSGLEYSDDAGAAGATAAGGTTSTGAAGGGGAGQGGSAAGAPSELSDEGLVARYFIDEAASGVVDALEDAAADPLPLTVTATSVLSFTETDGNRAMSWNAAGLDDRASVAIDGTKIHQRLHGSTTATVEVVVHLREPTVDASRISHIGKDTDSGLLTLRTRDAQLLLFRIGGGGPAGEYPVDMPGLGRIVLHAVVDSALAVPEDRTQLFVDGVPVAPTGGTPLAQDQALDMSTGCHYVLGNREMGGRSFAGELFYAALYDVALDEAAIANNVAVLQASDDRP